MKYIKELDSLRAIAVVLVIISHWIPSNHVMNRLPNGAIGVDIFFVLSGFLISKILFENRTNADLLNIPKSALIKNFYVRRTLRIFPIYYLTIFVLLCFSKSTETNIESAFLYFATYTANFYFFNSQHWDGMVSHLWSLAVEEQFYLIWPWIILFANKKYFLQIILFFVFVGVTSQYLLRDVNMSRILTFTCFDAFGLGAILSWVNTYANHKLKKFYLVLSIVSLVSFGLFVLGAPENKWTIVPLRTLISLMTLWIITYIIIHREKSTLKFAFIFHNPVLVFLGKISYGLYLYHNIVPGLLTSKIINNYLNPLLPDILYKTYWGQLMLMENIILLVAISWLSYNLIEKRFLNLKKHFEYQQGRCLPQKYRRQEPSVF